MAVPRDSLHERALGWASTISKTLLVSEYVLWETVNFLSPLKDRAKVYPLLEMIRTDHSFKFLPATPLLFEAGLTLHRARPDKGWSLTDCISFHLMRLYKLTKALTHDEHFVQAGFEALLRSDPPARKPEIF